MRRLSSILPETPSQLALFRCTPRVAARCIDSVHRVVRIVLHRNRWNAVMLTEGGAGDPGRNHAIAPVRAGIAVIRVSPSAVASVAVPP